MSQSLPKKKQVELFKTLIAIEKKAGKQELINRKTMKPYTTEQVNVYIKKYIEKVIKDEI